MDNIKPNSDKARESEAREVNRVTSHGIKVQKRTNIQKATDDFVNRDLNNAKTFVFKEVVWPVMSRALSDIVRQMMDGLARVVIDSVDDHLYGPDERRPSRKSHRSESWRDYYDDRDEPRRRSRDRDREERRTTRARLTDDFGIGELVFETRGDAERVLAELDRLIERYHVASVSDFYNAIDPRSLDDPDLVEKSWPTHSFGWIDIDDAAVTPVRGGYRIRMPRPMPIER